MLSSVKINCQVTKIVINTCSQLSEHPKCQIITAVLINISVLFVNQAVSPKVKLRHNKTFALLYVLKMLIFSEKDTLKLGRSFLVRSCLPITLIKCLKGRKSLGSLCNVKIKCHSVSDRLSSDKVTY